MDNHYKTLGVEPNASQAEIKERYRFLANAYHPDKFPNDAHKQHAEAEFKKINQAYQIISVPAQRAEYDRRIGLTRPSKSSQSGRTSHPNATPVPQGQNSLSSFGQSFLRTVAFAFLFYIAVNVVLRMGVGGLVVVLILAGLIYFKYFMK